MEDLEDDLAGKERRLVHLRQQVRQQSDTLLALTSEVERMQGMVPLTRKPIIGPAFLLGLVLGIPIWSLVALLLMGDM